MYGSSILLVVVRAWSTRPRHFFARQDRRKGLKEGCAFCTMRGLLQSRCFRMKTFVAKPQTIKRQWFVIDATDKVLGRVATEVARRLRGKHKPEYTPNIDTGDYIVVVNASKIRVTGEKARSKSYYRYSGYQSGLKRATFAEVQEKRPARLIEHAVRGMLPKNALGREMFRKLKVYAGADHKHAAQGPKSLQI